MEIQTCFAAFARPRHLSLFHVLKHTGTPEIMYSREHNGVASSYVNAHEFSYLNSKASDINKRLIIMF